MSMLPLAMAGSLVLLLSSLSLQTLVLHTRQVQATERTRLQAQDWLASGAQRLAAASPQSCSEPSAAAMNTAPATNSSSTVQPPSC